MVENKEKNFISAVVYIHNQEDRIEKFLKVLVNMLQAHFEKYEVVCVNDASTDKSVSEIKNYARTLTDGGIISILNMSYYQGLELSMNAGVDLAIGDFVYEFDNVYIDYPEEMIFEVYKQSLKGYDIVAAAPMYRQKMMSKLFYYVYNKVSNTQFRLRTETFRVLSRRAINRVHSMSKTTPYRKAVYANCGLKVSTQTYENKAHSVDSTSELRKKQTDIAVDTLILYSDAAYKFSVGFTGLLMIITVLMGVYTTYIYITGKPVAGWTTTMLFLAFAFFGVFAVMTIIIKYLSIVLSLIFTRQKYVIESIEKLNN